MGPDNTLTLRNVQRSHEDNYSCHAKNSLGTDEITYTLHIQGEPQGGKKEPLASRTRRELRTLARFLASRFAIINFTAVILGSAFLLQVVGKRITLSVRDIGST